MAREYARVKVTIWGDVDFRGLTPAAQHLYFMLLTDPDLNMAGIADWRPSRIVRRAAGWTVAAVNDAAQELADRDFIVLEEATEEALVRSFVRHDGVLKSPNLTRAMVKDYAAAGSDAIRETIAREVARGAQEEPDAKGLTAAAELLKKPTSKGSKSVPDRFDSSSGNRSGRVPDRFESSSVNHSRRVPDRFEPISPIPQPSTSNQQPRRGASAAAAAAGTDTPSTPTFDDFWKAYPKQVAEKLAKAAWGRATVDADPADILAGLHAQLPTLRAVSDPKFIPNPSTWLNDGRWTDQPPVEDDPWRDLPRIGGDS